MKTVTFHLVGGTRISFTAVEDGRAATLIAWMQQDSSDSAISFPEGKTDTTTGATHVFRRAAVAYLEVRDKE